MRVRQLHNVSELSVAKLGLISLSDHLKGEGGLLFFPRRRNGTKLFLSEGWYQRILSDRLQLSTSPTCDVSAAQTDIKHLSLIQCLWIRRLNINSCESASSQFHAHRHFLETIDERIHLFLGKRILSSLNMEIPPDRNQPGQGPSTDTRCVMQLGLKAVLLCGAHTRLLQDDKANPEQTICFPNVYGFNIDTAMFKSGDAQNTVSFFFVYTAMAAYEIGNAKVCFIIRDYTRDTKPRSLHWDVVDLEMGDEDSGKFNERVRVELNQCPKALNQCKSSKLRGNLLNLIGFRREILEGRRNSEKKLPTSIAEQLRLLRETYDLRSMTRHFDDLIAMQKMETHELRRRSPKRHTTGRSVTSEELPSEEESVGQGTIEELASFMQSSDSDVNDPALLRLQMLANASDQSSLSDLLELLQSSVDGAQTEIDPMIMDSKCRTNSVAVPGKPRDSSSDDLIQRGHNMQETSPDLEFVPLENIDRTNEKVICVAEESTSVRIAVEKLTDWDDLEEVNKQMSARDELAAVEKSITLEDLELDSKQVSARDEFSTVEKSITLEDLEVNSQISMRDEFIVVEKPISLDDLEFDNKQMSARIELSTVEKSASPEDLELDNEQMSAQIELSIVEQSATLEDLELDKKQMSVRIERSGVEKAATLEDLELDKEQMSVRIECSAVEKSTILDDLDNRQISARDELATVEKSITLEDVEEVNMQMSTRDELATVVESITLEDVWEVNKQISAPDELATVAESITLEVLEEVYKQMDAQDELAAVEKLVTLEDLQEVNKQMSARDEISTLEKLISLEVMEEVNKQMSARDELATVENSITLEDVEEVNKQMGVQYDLSAVEKSITLEDLEEVSSQMSVRDERATVDKSITLEDLEEVSSKMSVRDELATVENSIDLEDLEEVNKQMSARDELATVEKSITLEDVEKVNKQMGVQDDLSAVEKSITLEDLEEVRSQMSVRDERETVEKSITLEDLEEVSSQMSVRDERATVEKSITLEDLEEVSSKMSVRDEQATVGKSITLEDLEEVSSKMSVRDEGATAEIEVERGNLQDEIEVEREQTALHSTSNESLAQDVVMRDDHAPKTSAVSAPCEAPKNVLPVANHGYKAPRLTVGRGSSPCIGLMGAEARVRVGLPPSANLGLGSNVVYPIRPHLRLSEVLISSSSSRAPPMPSDVDAHSPNSCQANPDDDYDDSCEVADEGVNGVSLDRGKKIIYAARSAVRKPVFLRPTKQIMPSYTPPKVDVSRLSLRPLYGSRHEIGTSPQSKRSSKSLMSSWSNMSTGIRHPMCSISRASLSGYGTPINANLPLVSTPRISPPHIMPISTNSGAIGIRPLMRKPPDGKA